MSYHLIVSPSLPAKCQSAWDPACGRVLKAHTCSIRQYPGVHAPALETVLRLLQGHMCACTDAAAMEHILSTARWLVTLRKTRYWAIDGYSPVPGELLPLSGSILLQPMNNSSAGLLCCPDATPALHTACWSAHTGEALEPEVYPRPDGSVYICGSPEHIALPNDPKTIQVDPKSVEDLKEVARSVSSKLGEAPLEVGQSCFLPISPDGLPVMGKVPGVQGAYIASGNNSPPLPLLPIAPPPCTSGTHISDQGC